MAAPSRLWHSRRPLTSTDDLIALVMVMGLAVLTSVHCPLFSIARAMPQLHCAGSTTTRHAGEGENEGEDPPPFLLFADGAASPLSSFDSVPVVPSNPSNPSVLSPRCVVEDVEDANEVTNDTTLSSPYPLIATPASSRCLATPPTTGATAAADVEEGVGEEGACSFDGSQKRTAC